MADEQTILGVTWASISLGTTLVSLRLYSRISKGSASWDDYTIIAAAVDSLDKLFADLGKTFLNNARSDILPIADVSVCWIIGVIGSIAKYIASAEWRVTAHRASAAGSATTMWLKWKIIAVFQNGCSNFSRQDLNLPIPAAHHRSYSQILTARDSRVAEHPGHIHTSLSYISTTPVSIA